MLGPANWFFLVIIVTDPRSLLVAPGNLATVRLILYSCSTCNLGNALLFIIVVVVVIVFFLVHVAIIIRVESYSSGDCKKSYSFYGSCYQTIPKNQKNDHSTSFSDLSPKLTLVLWWFVD